MIDKEIYKLLEEYPEWAQAVKEYATPRKIMNRNMRIKIYLAAFRKYAGAQRQHVEALYKACNRNVQIMLCLQGFGDLLDIEDWRQEILAYMVGVPETTPHLDIIVKRLWDYFKARLEEAGTI